GVLKWVATDDPDTVDFFFSGRRRHTRSKRDWSSDVCSSDLFLVEVTYCDEQCWAIYKPELGERPLRDFEPGLYRRERVVFLLSETLGWQIVPTTVVRDDGPFG